MRYLPKSPAERTEMLREIGSSSIDDLFSTIPEEYRLKRDLNIPRQMGESEIIDHFTAAAVTHHGTIFSQAASMKTVSFSVVSACSAVLLRERRVQIASRDVASKLRKLGNGAERRQTV